MRNPDQAKRILRKLETIWLARPDDGFDSFKWMIKDAINAHPDMLSVLTDDELEHRLDECLKKMGLV